MQTNVNRAAKYALQWLTLTLTSTCHAGHCFARVDPSAPIFPRSSLRKRDLSIKGMHNNPVRALLSKNLDALPS